MEFEGIYPPLVTPLTADRQIDFESLKRVVDNLINGGMDGLFVLGSTAEMAYFTDAQRQAIVECIVEHNAGRLPVLVGCMDLTQARVIEQAKAMSSYAIDGIVVTAPFYALNSASEIADHFRLVKAAVGELPVFAYDIPVRIGGVKLSPEMLVQLGREGVVRGVKDSSGNDVAFRRLVMLNEEAGHPLACFTGHECVNDGMLLLGADGQVPGYANVDPRRYTAMAKAAKAGDWAEARRIQDEICRGFEIVYVAQGRGGDNGGVGAFKVAMQQLGIIDCAVQSAPMPEFTPEDQAAIREILVGVGLLEA